MTSLEDDRTRLDGAPSPEAIRLQISEANQRLLAFAQQSIAEQPFDFDKEVGIPLEESVVLQDGITAPAFWNHYLSGSAISHAISRVSEVEFKREPITPDIVQELIRFQRKTVALLHYWGSGPAVDDSLQQESVQVSLEAARAFHWGERSGLLPTFSNEVSSLGRQYALLSGIRLM